MEISKQIFDEVRSVVQSYAEERDVTVGADLYVGLVNYSRHIGVDELTGDELQQVLTTLGKIAIDIHKSTEVHGSALSKVFRILGCQEAMGDCKHAAETILGTGPTPVTLFDETIRLPEVVLVCRTVGRQK